MAKIQKNQTAGHWIDVNTDDHLHLLRDWYIKGTIFAGADSVSKLMGVTYLSQFEDLNSEFALRPVFKPDFSVHNIPWSFELLTLFNYVASRYSIDTMGDGQKLKVQADETMGNIENLIENGGQFSHLYTLNVDNLSKYNSDDRLLNDAIRKINTRNRIIMANLSNPTRPLNILS